ncbi:hypothetical protein K2173_004926 [Erythroxylum novogranatense]|uniref:Plastocyanin-like domain-containing protein n=1 Tax=Erythroxylum novogranatense TaxID=1862640 RepID=A0AAV8TB08_9ROSI|nr:hypothetical protein K2173_004926 [Erythroxylum novogranatense]
MPIFHGLRATIHDAIAILPKIGVLYPFPEPDKDKIIVLGFTLKFESGKTYFLIVNAALNEELFLKIAGQNLKVVEVDASYTKPFTAGVGISPCPPCVNALLGAFTDDLPANPPMPYNYTGNPPSNLQTTSGTGLYRLAYKDTVQLVLQGTNMIAPES